MGTNVSKPTTRNAITGEGIIVVEEDDDSGGIRKRSSPKSVRPRLRDDLDAELIQRDKRQFLNPADALDEFWGKSSPLKGAPPLVGSLSSVSTTDSPLTSPEQSPGTSPEHASVLSDVEELGERRSSGGQNRRASAPATAPSRASPSTSPGKLPLNSYIRRICMSGVKPRSKAFCMSGEEIRAVCQAAQQLFLSQPSLLELGTPIKVVGDIHGQFQDLLKIFQKCGMPPKTNFLFLGDYVDRGKQSLETIMLLLCLKLRYPGNVFMLRGNHECANVTKVYGFYDECKRRASIKSWRSIVDVFNTLPIAATIGGKIFCVHGGLSPQLRTLAQISGVARPTDIGDTGLMTDLLWSDPDAQAKEWADNDRGVSYVFGQRILEDFCRRFDFDLVARGHMVVQDGYEFFGRQRLVTIFSAPNYCGEFDNWGAVMSVNEDLLCSFDLLEPKKV